MNLRSLVIDLKISLQSPEDKTYIEVFKKYAKHYAALEKEIKDYLAK